MKIVQSVKPLDYAKFSILFYVFNFIRVIFDGRRDKLLEDKVYSIIKKKIKKKNLYLLDYGCGSLKFTKHLIKKKIVNKAICLDTYQYSLKKKD